MSNDWHIKINNVELGPLSADKLKQLAQQGTVTPDTPVKKGQAGVWHRAKDVQGLFAAPTSQSTPPPLPPSPAGNAGVAESVCPECWGTIPAGATKCENCEKLLSGQSRSESQTPAPPASRKAAMAARQRAKNRDANRRFIGAIILLGILVLAAVLFASFYVASSSVQPHHDYHPDAVQKTAASGVDFCCATTGVCLIVIPILNLLYFYLKRRR